METKIPEKKALRKEMSCRRDKMKPEDIREASRTIFERLRTQNFYRQAAVVFSYASFRSEVDTWSFNRQVLADGKILALPKVLGKEKMEFYQIKSMDRLVPGYMGIPEPGSECPPISPVRPESRRGMILVPGLAFDTDFYRLGYGGGYYDRYLSAYGLKQGDTGSEKSDIRRLISCGVAYDKQIVGQVPREWTDCSLDYIVTETRILERMDEK